MASPSVRHHLVSAGYQNNFSSHKRVAILDAASGCLVEERRTRDNWFQPSFNTFELPDGTAVDDLEREWADLERSVLNQIRDIRVGVRNPVLDGAVRNLFAIHLVRSRTYETAHRTLIADVKRDVGSALEGDAEAARRFIASIGRPPREGEMTTLVHRFANERLASRFTFIESMASVHNRLAAMFASWHVQVVEADPNGPGFVLADVPVVHYSGQRRAYGFRDHLAVGDANLIGAPLTRHVAAFLTHHAMRDVRLRTKKQLQTLNALFWRSAVLEVACHPDDVREARRVHAHLRELPPERIAAA